MVSLHVSLTQLVITTQLIFVVVALRNSVGKLNRVSAFVIFC
jgi:hypothetical protein